MLSPRMVALAVIAIMASKPYSPPAGRIGRVATLAQRTPSGPARGLALAMLASSPTGAHAARLQLDFGEWMIFDQLTASWHGLTGEYMLVILVTLVVTLGVWLFCQYRFLYALQGTSRDHWHSLVSLYGQSASQHRPYLEPSHTDDGTQTIAEQSPALRHRLPRKTYNKMPDSQDNESQTGFDYEHQLTRCTQTSTDDWTVWTPWVYLVRQLMRVRRRQLLFYSNGVQLQRVTRYLLDRISDANMTIGPGGPIDHEMTRWSASGMAQILDQSPEAAFSEARENLRLYQSGAGRYSDVVITRDIIRLHQGGLGRYVTGDSSPVFEQARPAPESATPQAAPSASSAAAAPSWGPQIDLHDLHTRSYVERMRTPLPKIPGVVPDNLTPEQVQRTTAYFANLREQRGRPHHELRPGELPAPHIHHPLHSLDDVMQAVRWHDRQDRMREEAARALQEGQLHEPPGGHSTLPVSPASSEVYSLPESRPDGGPFGLGQSRTLSYTFSSRGGSADSFS